jgi:hypothetical protein
VYSDFHKKCAQLSDEQLAELLDKVCTAVSQREIEFGQSGKDMGMLLIRIIKNGIILWEAHGAKIVFNMQLPNWPEPLQYKTGEKNDYQF